MFRHRRLVLLAVLAVLVSACLQTPPADATGEEVYQALCTRCHGDEATGGIGPPLGEGSVSADHPDEFMRNAIVRGRGRMPGFRNLSDAQVGRLIVYLRGLQGVAPDEGQGGTDS